MAWRVTAVLSAVPLLRDTQAAPSAFQDAPETAHPTAWAGERPPGCRPPCQAAEDIPFACFCASAQVVQDRALRKRQEAETGPGPATHAVSSAQRTLAAQNLPESTSCPQGPGPSVPFSSFTLKTTTSCRPARGGGPQAESRARRVAPAQLLLRTFKLAAGGRLLTWAGARMDLPAPVTSTPTRYDHVVTRVLAFGKHPARCQGPHQRE